jgi:hypothetical protein
VNSSRPGVVSLSHFSKSDESKRKKIDIHLPTK